MPRRPSNQNFGMSVSEHVALNWDHVDLNSDPPELFLPAGLQTGTKRDAYLDLEEETARQPALSQRCVEDD